MNAKLFGRTALAGAILGMALLLGSAGLPSAQAAPGRASSWAAPDPPGYSLYLPAVSRVDRFTLSGRVANRSGTPLSGASVQLSDGRTATTLADGAYFLADLPAGAYTLTPSYPGALFAPLSRTITLPPSAAQQDFTWLACTPKLLDNGGFESSGDWDYATTDATAYRDKTQHHSGQWALLAGITDPTENKNTDSYAEQDVALPAAVNARLVVWMYPRVTPEATPVAPGPDAADAAGAGADLQYVRVFDHHGALLDTLFTGRDNNRHWSQYIFLLTPYAGQTITLRFGANNNGQGGLTAAWFDDISVEICE